MSLIALFTSFNLLYLKKVWERSQVQIKPAHQWIRNAAQGKTNTFFPEGLLLIFFSHDSVHPRLLFDTNPGSVTILLFELQGGSPCSARKRVCCSGQLLPHFRANFRKWSEWKSPGVTELRWVRSLVSQRYTVSGELSHRKRSWGQ